MSEILTPISDELYPIPSNIRQTTFRFGPLFIHFILKDLEKVPDVTKKTVKDVEEHDHEISFQRYTIFAIVNDYQAYILGSYTEEDEAMVNFRDIVQKLKYGKEVELQDQASNYETLQISYRGIKWLWE